MQKNKNLKYRRYISVLTNKQQRQYDEYVRLYKKASATRQMKDYAFMYNPEEWRAEFNRMKLMLQNTGSSAISTNRALIADQTFYRAEDTFQDIYKLYKKRAGEILEMPPEMRTPAQQRFLDMNNPRFIEVKEVDKNGNIVIRRDVIINTTKTSIFKNIKLQEEFLIDTYASHAEYYEARSPKDVQI